MDLKDNESWDKMIYSLLYPGVLGSMIYNTSECLRATHPFDWYYLSQALVVILYTIDYLHLEGDLRPEGVSSGLCRILDACIALLFGAVSWSMSREDFGRSFDLLVIIAILAVIYKCPPTWRKSWYNFGKGLNFFVVVSAWFYSQSRGFLGGLYTSYLLAAIVLVYSAQVFIFVQLAKVRTTPQKTALDGDSTGASIPPGS